MKRNEILELNGVEYTLELNRDSALAIEKRVNLKEVEKIINTEREIEYIDEIPLDEDPFADNELEKLEEDANNKINALKKAVQVAFYIWLYPEHKMNINQVKELLEPEFEDDKKMKDLFMIFKDCMEKCSNITSEYRNNSKNLKALNNK